MKNKKAFLDFRSRASERGATRGRDLEKEVEKILSKMEAEGKLSSVVYHSPNSLPDSEGKDFTVGQTNEGGEELFRSFGVTVSMRRWGRSKVLHRDVPQLCFPPGTKPETIQKRVLELFSLKS